MPISAGAFINGRVGELDLIRSGWRFMQRELSDEEFQRFETMVNMPGFCVRKFEDTYLVKKINPFAQTPEQRVISFSHMDCNCSHSKDVREVTEMKQQLSQFLEKWEDVFKHLPGNSSSAPPPATLIKVNDLQQETAKQLEQIQEPPKKSKETDNKKKNESVNAEVALKPKKATKGNAVAEQCQWNVAHVLGKPLSPTDSSTAANTAASTSTVKTAPDSKSPAAVLEPRPEKSKEAKAAVKTEPKSNVKSTTEPEKIKSEFAVPPTPVPSAQEKPISVACTEETVSLPSPTHDVVSPAITDNGRTAGTPDSGMISDVSEFKTIETDSQKGEDVKEKDPEKMTGRDGRRYRQKLREAERSAKEQMKVDEESEAASESQGRVSTESEPVGSDQVVMTGKEKRRLKDKLRKEKKEQERLTAQASVEVDEEKSTDQPPAATEIGSESLTDSHIASENAPVDGDQKATEAESCDDDAIQMKPDEESHAVEDGFAYQKAGMAVLFDEERYKEIPYDVWTNIPCEPVKKLSKSQKKRAQKKANKGVYVVNENGSQSYELLPGEYKIMQLNDNKKIEELPLEILPRREVNVDMKVDERQQEYEGKQKPKNNFRVYGNLSQDILDNGKWLAYVVDDKNPDGTPRIGEVNTEEVKKTIELLDTKLTLAEQNYAPADRYIDDFDYDSIMSDGQANQFVRQILPELDADYVRDTFQKIEREKRGADGADGAGEALYYPNIMGDVPNDPDADDLKAYLEMDDNSIVFQTEFARRTSPLFIGNVEFKDFCRKYASSKFDPKTIFTLIKKYIDTRIVFHFERFKKLADYDSRRISECWTHVTESSAYALMVMLYINNSTTSVGFEDIEAVLFC